MQVAIIAPPASAFQEAVTQTNYHLFLPQWLSGGRHQNAYTFLVKSLARDATRFTMLDNGAAEGVKFKWVDLLNMVEEFGIDELVLPDTLRDATQTLLQVQLALRVHKPSWLRYAAVVQGTSVKDMKRLAETYIDMPQVDTLALPRLAVAFQKDARIVVAQYLLEKYGDDCPPIHCLGASHLWPREVMHLAKLPNIRGLDTSMPVANGVSRVDMGNTKAHVVPRPDWFDTKVDSNALVMKNIETYLTWAGYNQSDYND